jgi:predicted patatin/cPLA2 family phospholipase
MAKGEQNAEGNRPEVRFQFGNVSSSIFVNTAQRNDGTTFQVRRTVLQKAYRDPSTGDFRNTQSLDVNDLPRAILALQKAFEHCLSVDRQEGSAE